MRRIRQNGSSFHGFEIWLSIPETPHHVVQLYVGATHWVSGSWFDLREHCLQLGIALHSKPLGSLRAEVPAEPIAAHQSRLGVWDCGNYSVKQNPDTHASYGCFIVRKIYRCTFDFEQNCNVLSYPPYSRKYELKQMFLPSFFLIFFLSLFIVPFLRWGFDYNLWRKEEILSSPRLFLLIVTAAAGWEALRGGFRLHSSAVSRYVTSAHRHEHRG